MFSHRNLVIAGVVLIAIALGSSGHGLWWLVGFLWFLPHLGRRGHHCGGAARGCGHVGDSAQTLPTDAQVGSPAPDAHHDRHVAFPETR
ncbi:MAG TPA: hypothetical protein VFL38_04830 [Humibacillus xanthopallidus]|nr:hypothetical protein [Humibacillus xanthopallidus]